MEHVNEAEWRSRKRTSCPACDELLDTRDRVVETLWPDDGSRAGQWPITQFIHALHDEALL